jgi:hypothetical protein
MNSQMGRGLMTELPGKRWFGRTVNPGWASKLTWATTRRPKMQSALLSLGHWNRLREDKRRRGSQSSRTPKPSCGWPRRNPAPAKSTRSKQGSTSQCYGKPGQVSSPRSGGNWPIRVSLATKKPTSGPRLRRRSRTPWDGMPELLGPTGGAQDAAPLANIKREISEKKWTKAR